MKCYDFELNISAYIEGELKQVIRQSFNEHKDNCTLCKEKLADISQLMNNMPHLMPHVTSPKFIHNLNQKIQKIEKILAKKGNTRLTNMLYLCRNCK